MLGICLELFYRLDIHQQCRNVMGKGAIIFQDQCLVDPGVGFVYLEDLFYLSQIGHVVTYVISRRQVSLSSSLLNILHSFIYVCENQQQHVFVPYIRLFASCFPESVLNSQGHRFHFHGHYASII